MRLASFLLLFSFSLFAAVFNEQKEPKKELVAIFETLYIPHTKEDNSLFEGAKHLLRKEGKERVYLTEKNLTYEQKSALLVHLHALGFVEEVKPDSLDYDDVFVLGSYAADIKARMEYLIRLYNNGLRFKRLFFLTGERRRDPFHDSDRLIFFSDKLPLSTEISTEADIMRLIWMQLDKPKELISIQPLIINAPCRLLKNGKKSRPNTYDSVELFLKSGYDTTSKRWLACSSQPHISYQEALLQRILPKSYSGMTVGPAAASQTLFSNYLDALARTVHNEFWTNHPDTKPIN